MCFLVLLFCDSPEHTDITNFIVNHKTNTFILTKAKGDIFEFEGFSLCKFKFVFLDFFSDIPVSKL